MKNISDYESLREQLEKDYNAIETKISFYYETDQVAEALKLEHDLNVIDDQLDLLDEIIVNLKNTPKLIDRFNTLNKEYNKNVGE